MTTAKLIDIYARKIGLELVGVFAGSERERIIAEGLRAALAAREGFVLVPRELPYETIGAIADECFEDTKKKDACAMVRLFHRVMLRKIAAAPSENEHG